MARFLAVATVLATILALASTSEGKGGKGSSGNSGSHSTHNSSHSMHSHDSHYGNWSSWNWNSRYGCYFYYSPTYGCDYYWYAPSCCYYPVSYIAQYPPTQTSYQQTSPGVAPMPIQVTNVNSNAAANGAVVPPVASVPPLVTGPMPK